MNGFCTHSAIAANANAPCEEARSHLHSAWFGRLTYMYSRIDVIMRPQHPLPQCASPLYISRATRLQPVTPTPAFQILKFHLHPFSQTTSKLAHIVLAPFRPSPTNSNPISHA